MTQKLTMQLPLLHKVSVRRKSSLLGVMPVSRTVRFLFLFLFGGLIVVRGQGTFNVTISGIELFGGSRLQINGGGTLQFDRGSLSYNLFVPVNFILPRETHFHGPPVEGEHPIISLVPFVQERGGIRYHGTTQIPGKFHPDLIAGNWYINLHATDYENGVLTGTIIPVPEPSPIIIILAGAAFIFARRRSIPETAVPPVAYLDQSPQNRWGGRPKPHCSCGTRDAN